MTLCEKCGHYRVYTSPDKRALASHSSAVVEAVALAMAASEGNGDNNVANAIRGGYDYAGYLDLAHAAIVELERLGLLARATPADATAGTASEPRGDLAAVPRRGVTAT